MLIIQSNALTLRRDKSIFFSRNSLVSLIGSSIIAFLSLDLVFFGSNLTLFGGLFHVTVMTCAFHIFLYIISAIIIQLSGFFPRKLFIDSYSNLRSLLSTAFSYKNGNISNKGGQQFNIIEYSLILLFIILGATFLMCCIDIISVFLSVELQSYGLYILTTLHRDSELSTAAGLMYFLLGSLSSCIILLGTSLLYANSGTSSLDGYYIITIVSSVIYEFKDQLSDFYKSLYMNMSLLIMSVGFLFKMSAAPFHFWSPDVYDNIPTITTTFVAIIAKISILIFLLELVLHTSNLFFSNGFAWTYSLLLSSLFSFIVGTILGLTQSRIKRLLAYSTISHLAFILLAITINSAESIQAFVFYILQYTVSNLNIFFILIAIGYSLYPFINEGPVGNGYKALVERNNTPIQLIAELKGYFYVNPLMGLSLAITIFSFVGVPPLIGFFAKQMVLSASLDNGYIFLAVIAIIASVISSAYYLHVVKQIFFDKTEFKLSESIKGLIYNCIVEPFLNSSNNSVNTVIYGITNIILSVYLTITISILTIITLFYMFASKEWLSMTRLLSIAMFNP